MSINRSAAILVVVFALLGLAGPAAAVTSRLTATPPVTLTATAPTQPRAGPAGSPAPPDAAGLPRTGSDIPSELLLATVLLAGGGILRLRWPTDRS